MALCVDWTRDQNYTVRMALRGSGLLDGINCWMDLLEAYL